MLNKRLLIKNLLSYNDENSFYDNKEYLSLGSRRAKAKFLKHICAFSNANPKNHSYIVIGVEDEKNIIKGTPFFDDSRIQSLVNSNLINPPKVQYENVHFPHLPRHKVVGLVTIFPNEKITTLKRNLWEYKAHQLFVRKGSTSVVVENLVLENKNQSVVEDIENQSKNNIDQTLGAVLDFMKRHPKKLHPTCKVFKDQYVLCWAGKEKKVENKIFYTRVDIELVNEQIRLFYSAMDEVKIVVSQESFIITEYVPLGINNTVQFYPLEKIILHFKENGTYNIHTEILFKPPKFHRDIISHLYQKNNKILNRLENNNTLNNSENKQLESLAADYLICYFNGIEEALDKLNKSKVYLKKLENKAPYIHYKEIKRILRKTNAV